MCLEKQILLGRLKMVSKFKISWNMELLLCMEVYKRYSYPAIPSPTVVWCLVFGVPLSLHHLISYLHV